MLFEKKYNYYLVEFDDDTTYWYRSLSTVLRLGNRFFIAKAALFDFLCSDFYDTVQQKSAKHAEAIAEIREKFR